MAKARVVLRSRFPAANKEMWAAVALARDKALDAGEDTAETRIEQANNAKGYNLPGDIEQEKTGFQSGRIWHPRWEMRFHEFGTVYIPASPFMRPAHRQMRKVFLATMGVAAPRFIKRAAVR